MVSWREEKCTKHSVVLRELMGFTWMERTAAMVIISSEHPSSPEDNIIFAIIGSYKTFNLNKLVKFLFTVPVQKCEH